ncbi:MAG: S8 family serine peptidase [Pleurocapsa sp. SU_196_0]|nr:S8 family serine peptidase [Pleurocapsa sp. SU_196_0]
MLSTTTFAWGERIAVNGATSVRVNYPDAPRVFTLTPGQQFFDLPKPPRNLEIITDATVTLETYGSKLDATMYTRRASVEILGKTFFPYGSVTIGEIEFLASVPVGGCSRLFSSVNARLTSTGVSGFMIGTDEEDKFTVSVGSKFDLCQAVVLVGQQTTVQALSKLDGTLLAYSPRLPVISGVGYVLDNNTVMSLMQASGAYAYDPSCDEIQRKLDPISANGFDRVTMTKLRADINPNGVQMQGSNVGIVVIGGGFGTQDQFDCRPNYPFAKHDTYIEDILDLFASSAAVRDEVACDSSGTCKSSNVSRALMRTVAFPPQPNTVVNMSLGGPLPSKVMYALIQLLATEREIPVITSSGNTPSAPAQYPASYAEGVAVGTEPMLSNVISVAAIGWRNNAYEIASFNTRKNANVFAPGVNLCLTTLLSKRCLNGAYPQNIGVSGTSFAAPVVTAVSVVLIQQTGRMPHDLLGCLEANLADPSKAVSYPALMNKPCQ